MCIIIVKPVGAKMPQQAILDRCALLNPHGFGFATKDRIFKTLSYKEFKEELRTIGKNETAILHFRYATHGSIKVENCHPFKDEDTGVCFAHNGILNIEPYEDMTDSETAFRGLIVPKIKEHGLFSREVNEEVFNVIGGSRFAMIDKDGEFNIYGRFTMHKDCYYSNQNFLPIYNRYYSY